MLFRLAMRQTAVLLLQQAATLAGDRVESNRATDVDENEMPFLGVYTGHEVKLSATEGTNPVFQAIFTLHVDVRVANADMAATETMLDILIGQTQDALLNSAAFWMPQQNGSRLVRNVSKIEVQSTVKQDAEVNYGIGQVSFEIEYSDAYAIAITQPLNSIVVTAAPNLTPAAPPAASPDVTVTFNLTSPGLALA